MSVLGVFLVRIQSECGKIEEETSTRSLTKYLRNTEKKSQYKIIIDNQSLRKIPKFHSFRKVSGDSHIAQNSAETAFSQNLYTRKLGKILAFCLMYLKQIMSSRF